MAMAETRTGSETRSRFRWLSLWLLGFLFASIFTLPLFAQDWPSCGSTGCTAGDLTVTRVYIDAQSCAGATRTGVLKADLFASSTRYNIRVTAQVYVIGSGVPGYLKTVDYCWPGEFTGSHTVTLDSNVSWDCDASLELRYTLVSWQIQGDNYTCGAVLPCSAITPKCNGDYYSQQIAVEGSEPPNTAPTGSASSVITSEDASYTFAVGDFGYSDPESDPLAQIQITNLELVGDLLLSGSPVGVNEVVTAAQLNAGALTYEPLPDESGSPYDSFQFLVHDGTVYAVSSATMTIHVTGVNDPPVAIDDIATTERNQSVFISVLVNDSDPEGGILVLASATDPSHGTLDLGGGLIRYTPDFLYTGPDAFTYSIQDPAGASATASVAVTVENPNQPPIANANGTYNGMVGDPIKLDARFSIDPDITDVLQYRWDINGDGVWDTEWLSSATLEVVYERPYRGPVILEVRDLYLGFPNGTDDQASTFALIVPRPTQIAVTVFVDLNANGIFDDGDVGLPGVALVIGEGMLLSTGDDGTAFATNLDPGLYSVRISDEGIAFMEERGFFLSEEALASVEVESGDWVALFFTPEARGFLEVDLGADADGD